MPLAPARFSTTKGCPSLLPSRSAMMRATTSTGPPALKPTMTLTGRTGYFCARPRSSRTIRRRSPAGEAFVALVLSPDLVRRLCMYVGAARSTIMMSGRAGFRNRVCAPAFRRAAGQGSFATKNAKTTPCTVAGAVRTRTCTIQDLRQQGLRSRRSRLTRRAKHWHDGIIATIASVHTRPTTGAPRRLRVSPSSTSRKSHSAQQASE